MRVEAGSDELERREGLLTEVGLRARFGGDHEEEAVDDGGGLEADIQEGKVFMAFEPFQPGVKLALLLHRGGEEEFQRRSTRPGSVLEMAGGGKEAGIRGGGKAREEAVRAGVEVAGLGTALAILDLRFLISIWER